MAFTDSNYMIFRYYQLDIMGIVDFNWEKLESIKFRPTARAKQTEETLWQHKR